MNNNNKFLWQQTMMRRVNKKLEKFDSYSGKAGHWIGDGTGKIIGVNQEEYFFQMWVEETKDSWNNCQREKRMQWLGSKLRKILDCFRGR
jgi:hypothetical protein